MSRKKLPKPVVQREHPGGATALQLDAPDGSRLACLENLRVLITKEDGVWLAQGLEIDYAIDGDSLADVKKRFEDGLTMTITSNLRVHNSINPLLQVAPQKIWNQWNDAKNTLRRFKHSTILVTPQRQSELPFDQIMWLDATQTDEAA